MKLSYDYTEQDYVKFHVHKHQNSDLRQRIINAFLFTICAVFSVTFLWNVDLSITSGIGTTLFVISVLLSYRQARLKKEKEKDKAYEKAKYINSFGHIELTVTNDGLSLNEDEGFIRWDDIISVEEVKKYIYIYLRQINALKIPKRAFKNKKDELHFIETINKFIR